MKRMVLLMSVFFTSMVSLLFSPVVFGTPLSDVNQELMGRAYEQIHGVHAREMFVGLKKILKLKDDRKFIQELIEQTPKSQKIKLSVSGNDLVMSVGGEKINVGFQKAIEGKFLINGKELNVTSHRSFRSLYTAINKLYQKPSKSPSVFLSLIAPKAYALGLIATSAIAAMTPVILIPSILNGIDFLGSDTNLGGTPMDERLLQSLDPTEFSCRRDKDDQSFSDITVGGKKYTLKIRDGAFNRPRIKSISVGKADGHKREIIFANDGFRGRYRRGSVIRTEPYPKSVQASDFSKAVFRDYKSSRFYQGDKRGLKKLAEKNFKPFLRVGLTAIADCCDGALENFQFNKRSYGTMGARSRTCEEKVQQAIAKKHPKKDSSGDDGTTNNRTTVK